MKRIFSGNRDSREFDLLAENLGFFVGSDGRTYTENPGEYKIVDWYGPINGCDFPNGVDIDIEEKKGKNNEKQ